MTVPLAEPDKLGRGLRLGLVLTALAWAAVLGLAAWLNPYDADGTPKSHGTHRQLGLPPCTFMVVTRQPCPSCGMTTSFALLMHGDLRRSLAANWVGTLLASFGVLLVPWCLVGALRGKYLGVRAVEPLVLAAVMIFLGLALLRWGIVVLPGWLFGRG